MENKSIDDGQIFDQTLEKIGKTMKNYNILKYIYENENEDVLDDYVDDLKKRIKDYLIKFYKLDQKLDYNFLKCWTNTFYENNDLEEMKDYISFKYFDIRKNPENQQKFEIIYLYNIVEEIMVEIFSHIFYQNVKLKSILGVLGIDGGAKGCVFEKFIIHKMKPNDKYLPAFGYFKINKVIQCDKFVPKSNENWDKFIKSKQTFIKCTYLFEQKIFGGKAFDAAIIELKTNGEIIAYLFQISIMKPYRDIFFLSQLKKNIEDFARYFSKVYDLLFDDVYFTYIFDYSNKDDVSSSCIIKEMPFIFFKTEEEEFVDSDGEIINLNENNIKDYFINPLDFGKETFSFRKNKILETINLKQEESIINFIKEEKFFGIKKGKKVFFDISNDTIDLVLKEGNQKRRFFIQELSLEESKDYYHSIYETDKTFLKKYKNILNYNCLLFIYFNDKKNIISHIILDNGVIYKIKFTPGNLLYNAKFNCYEICLK